MAQGQGAEVVDFQAEDPVQMILRLTAGIGVDRVIDVVGVDATRPLTQAEPLVSAIDTYQTFDARRPGWMKVKLEPRMA